MKMFLRRFFARLRSVPKREEAERELNDEIRAHLQIEEDEQRAAGVSPNEARDAARRAFGNVTLAKEASRDAWIFRRFEELVHDLSYAFRLLRLNPGFALAAILSLALGIGANTAIFQLLDAVRLRSLPVNHPQELAHIYIPDQKGSGSYVTRYPELTNAIWKSIRENQQGFSGVFVWGPTTFNLSSGGESRYAQGLWVSGEFFDVLDVKPIAGRVFTPSDDHAGCGASGVVISYSFWQREFGGASDVLGKKISLEGHPFEVIGITPTSFSGVETGRNFDVAVLLCADPVLRGEFSQYDNPQGWWLTAMGRLKPGWTIERAAAQLRAVSPTVFREALPSAYDSDSAKSFLSNRLDAIPASSGISELRANYENPLWMLLGLAGMVLLIACANLANLLLARASAREKEFGIRLALGAARGRVVRQLLVESLLLSGVGAICGIFLARALGQSLISFLSTKQDPAFVDLGASWHVLAFTTALAGITCVLFGLAPALKATKVSPGIVLKSSGRGMTAGRERFGLRRTLLISQVALSLVLLVGALLFARSLRKLSIVDAGFRDSGILIASIDFTRLNIPAGRRVEFNRNLMERIRVIPGVDSVADVEIIPISGNAENRGMVAGGQTEAARKLSLVNRIGPEYFKLMGTAFLEGRDFNEHDGPAAPQVAIVNQAFAEKFFAGSSPIGKTIRFAGGKGKPQPEFQIVGVVANTKYLDLREKFKSIAFMPLAQRDSPDPADQILVRSSMPLAGLVAQVKSAVADVNPSIQLDFQPFHTVLQDSLLPDRLMATLSGFFGALAAVLATIGLYGVISYMVARRRNEIGIRMALGAKSSDILRLVLGEGLFLTLVGIGIGLMCAAALSRLVTNSLFGIAPLDALTFCGATVLLLTIATLACYFPARRAMRVDPMTALHYE
jgi:putative ABC transport system permease protein